MKTHEEYLQELEKYCETIISSSKVQSSGKKGTLGGLQSYLENYTEEIKNVSDKISEKASELLNEGRKDENINNDKLKEGLTKIANEMAQKFINKTNREFKNG
jgi:signal-transduction protein with cAMP-binding, CBS, and nucleotidyltransferase domain